MLTRIVGVTERLRQQGRGHADIEAIVEEMERHKYTAGDLDLVRRAYDYAATSHEGQKRATGGPFIEHPAAVALLIAQLGMDPPSIAAALLHDVPEDTSRTNEDIRRSFGDEVARLVEG